MRHYLLAIDLFEERVGCEEGVGAFFRRGVFPLLSMRQKIAMSEKQLWRGCFSAQNRLIGDKKGILGQTEQ